MPRAKKVTDPVQTTVDLETQASDAGAVLATETAPATGREGKLYSSDELDVILRIAVSLLGQQAYGLHPDALQSRARDAFCNAEAILPIYRDIADKDA